MNLYPRCRQFKYNFKTFAEIYEIEFFIFKGCFLYFSSGIHGVLHDALRYVFATPGVCHDGSSSKNVHYTFFFDIVSYVSCFRYCIVKMARAYFIV